MAFNISKALKNQCLGKVAHATKVSAEYSLENMEKTPSHILEVYTCPFCKKYHIGHKLGTKKKNK